MSLRVVVREDGKEIGAVMWDGRTVFARPADPAYDQALLRIIKRPVIVGNSRILANENAELFVRSLYRQYRSVLSCSPAEGVVN